MLAKKADGHGGSKASLTVNQQWLIAWWGEFVEILSKPCVGNMHGVGDAASFEFIRIAHIHNPCIAGLDVLLEFVSVDFLRGFRLHSIGRRLEDFRSHHTFDPVDPDAVQQSDILFRDAAIDQKDHGLIPLHEGAD